MNKKFLTLCALLIAISTSIANAHHSAARFNFAQMVTIEGIVKKFNVHNPHTRATITVTDEKGTRDVEYEGHSAGHFYRAGYNRGSVNPGDKIYILIAPRNDGDDGGYINAFTVNGVTVGFGNLAPDTGQ